MAITDELTKFKNKRTFEAHIHELVLNTKRQFNLYILNIEDLKEINAVFGQSVGDQYLKEVSNLLQKLQKMAIPAKNDLLYPTTPTFYRLGAAEFACIVPTNEANLNIELFAEEILNLFKTDIYFQENSFKVTTSIGVASSENKQSIVKCAQTALTYARANNKGGYCLFNAQLDDLTKKKVVFESEFKKALGNNEVFLQFQPKVSAASRSIIGFEALARWMHPQKGLIPPVEFIPLAEQTGLIIQLGEYIVDKACHQISIWLKDGIPSDNLTVAINVSIAQLQQKGTSDFKQVLKKYIALYDIPPSTIQLEITESLLATDESVQKINDLKSLGVKIALDDFGTGYSCMSALNKLQLDYIKLDKSFVNELDTKQGKTLCKALIDLGHAIGTRVIAEGVETLAQVCALQAMKCNEYQGYYFSKPVSADDARKQIATQLGGCLTDSEILLELENSIKKENQPSKELID